MGINALKHFKQTYDCMRTVCLILYGALQPTFHKYKILIV